MADDTTDPDMAQADTAASDGGKAGAGRKRLLVFGAIGAFVLIGAGGGAWYMLAGRHTDRAGHAVPAAHKPSGPDALVDVPPLVVNIRAPGTEPRFIKIHFMLVAADPKQVETIKGEIPALIDAYQPFLRELRPDDIAGAEGVYRVKEELLVRAHDVLGANAVDDVLIEDMLQQ